MMRRRTTILTGILALAGATIILTGCGGGSGAATPTPTPTPTATTVAPSPTPTSAPSSAAPTAAAANIPASCDAVGSAMSRSETVDGMTVQDHGEGFVRPSPQGATLALGCDWIVGDSTGILLLISTASPAQVTAAVSGLPGQGFTCQVSDDFGAQYCTKPGTGDDSEDAVVARDGTWIYLESHNVNARALLSALSSQVFQG